MRKYLNARLKSFRYAGAGLMFLLKSEPHARIHLLATTLVIITAIAFDVTRQDWLWLTLAITLVWAFEAMNTAIEHLCDLVSPEQSESVKRAKDVAAGAVLIAAIAAVIIGIGVFSPYICALI
ncbi:diacylglycerol kinase [Rhodobacterales bacterium 52_120_T64]|nr:diacylglycerol kinase [Rhodobacterales bacterium 52_120_T64]